MERLPRIYELSVLLGRTTTKSDALTAGHMQEAGGLTMEMQEFLQGLDENETACTFFTYSQKVLSACQSAGRTMQEYLA